MDKTQNDIKKEDRKTSRYLSDYEFAMVIGERARMIRDDGSSKNLFIEISKLDPKRIHDPIYIAKEEFRAGKLPFIIRREVGEKVEFWELISDKMTYINTTY